MAAFFVYLLKSSAVIGLFFVTYHLFLRKETLFFENRLFLISGLLVSILLPFLEIRRVILLDSGIANDLSMTAEKSLIANQAVPVNWEILLLVIYILGVLFFISRLILQLASVRRLIKTGKIKKHERSYHVKTQKRVSPFSFFNYIFYNPAQFNQEELKSIIAHEEVHAREYHSIDILLLELVFILQWFNPILWPYRTFVKQNLEFLADSRAFERVTCKKTYQYLMLKQVIVEKKPTVTNPFYNSLIKKRIVMLNQNQSKKMNAIKLFLVLPMLALFLMAFNTKKVYSFNTPEGAQVRSDQSIELIIDKDTSNDELEKMKKNLAEDNIDFSYTVIHNDNNEIIDITLHISGQSSDGEKFSGNYNSSSDDPIKPIAVFYDHETNRISFGNAISKKVHVHKTEGGSETVRVDLGEGGEQKTITVRTENGTKKIFVDGKEVDEDTLHEMNFHITMDEHDDDDLSIHVVSSDEDKKRKTKRVKFKKHKDGKVKENVMMIKDSDDDTTIEVIAKGEGSLIVDVDGKEKPLIYIDGKKATEKQAKKLSAESIESMNVLKGEKAIEKYGKKAENGVVEITTKKEK
ncbi:M56 family metallopeptidase [Ulvibacterium sp.]|uniref:M56 family metallopeptidase n=1 Tax=Ulvibacterium sp. TaxID=2665914 RepID=UPI003BAC7837